MKIIQPSTLQLPSFLYGTYATVERQAQDEGRRCARHYQISGTLPQSHEMRNVCAEDIIFTHDVVDFQEEHPAWRIYMVSEGMMRFSGTDEQNYRQLNELYETCFR